MSGRRPGFTPPVSWSPSDLERDRQLAIAVFRRERLAESGAAYAAAHAHATGAIEALLAATADLVAL